MNEDKNAIGSAVLTATIKSVKLLTSLNESQLTMAQDMKDIKLAQKENAQAISELLNLPKPQEFDEIKASLTELQDSIGDLNLSNVVTAVNNNTNQQSEKHTAKASENLSTILASITENTYPENIKTLRKLIAGLYNMQKNILTLATRVEALSGNVNNVQTNAKALNGTIMESNSRITSMDMRMAALVDQDDTPDDLAGALEMLESVSTEIVEPSHTAQTPLVAPARVNSIEDSTDDHYEPEAPDVSKKIDELEDPEEPKNLEDVDTSGYVPYEGLPESDKEPLNLTDGIYSTIDELTALSDELDDSKTSPSDSE